MMAGYDYADYDSADSGEQEHFFCRGPEGPSDPFSGWAWRPKLRFFGEGLEARVALFLVET